MGYTTYDKSIYRTGFRPYGQTNAWAASQLNGMDTTEAVLSGYLGQSHPFMPSGGWGLHGSASFHPWVLEGLGAAVCLDETENTVACTSPDCTYGDCGSTDTQKVGGALCLDDSENQVSCYSPNCKYGDCTGPLNLPPGPSPRVPVPPNQAPPTAPGYKLPTSIFTASTIVRGVPDVVIYGFGAVALMSLLGSSGGRRR